LTNTLDLRHSLHLLALIAAAGGHVSTRFLEFFAPTIRNPHAACAAERNRKDRWTTPTASMCQSAA